MKFSFNWIGELVEGLDLAPLDLERLITMKTAECEGIEDVAPLLASASAARIVAVEEIAGSHNRKAVVETARYGRKTVVCGAPNCRSGITSVYVKDGVKRIQGVESDGMLASGAELGISRDGAGILEIEGDLELRPDHVIEIDNKSITHRPDLWGHLGMAREVAAISGKPLRDPVRMDLLPSGPPAVKVVIEDFDLCPRYSALVFDNVTVKPSPLWLQYRLEAIGLNPINNIVDFTNLVMAELGQPTHAFDRELLAGDTIFVRPARAGERIVALDDEDYALGEGNLAIADARGPVAIAGVIGGRDSAIGPNTRSIVLESANFHATSVRRTSAALKLRTDASMRFEKSQDPNNTARALARAVALLEGLSPGIRLVGGVADLKRESPPPKPIPLPMNWLRRKLGIDVPAKRVREILSALEFLVEGTDDELLVTPPSWRATKDISVKDDLVEEVGRMVGYGEITPRAPSLPVTVPPRNPERAYLRSVRERIAAQGFTEVYNYSFLSEEDARAFGFDPAAHVRVANPIASDQTLMRLSLLPGIRKNLIENAKRFDSFRLFEIGREIHKQETGLPREATCLAAAIYAQDDGVAGLLEVKRAAECLAPGAEVRPAGAREYEHPARSGEVLWRGRTVGRIFELHPKLIEGRAAILYLDLDAMLPLSAEEKRYTPPRRFPSSAFDLSVIAGARELVGDLLAKLKSFVAPEMLEEAEYVRQYSGPPLAEGTKSVSFRFTVSSAAKTLSSEEVGEIRNRVIDGMRRLGYELRV